MLLHFMFTVSICIITHGYIGKTGEPLKLNRLFFSGIGLPHTPNIGNLNLSKCILYINLPKDKKAF